MANCRLGSEDADRMKFLLHLILLVISAIPEQSCVHALARGIWEVNLSGRLLAFEFQILVNDKFPAST